MTMQGDLQYMNVPDLIQHNCLDKKTARLLIMNDQEQATLFFKGGQILHAELGSLQGVEVIYEILEWREGTFSLDLNVDSSVQTIKENWISILMEGARRLDEKNNTIVTQSVDEHFPEATKDVAIAEDQILEQDHTSFKENKMSNINEILSAIMQVDGAIAVAIVDWKSGLTLGTQGSGFDIDLAAAGNTNVVRSKMSVMKDLKLKGGIEDILITLSEQYHLIRMLESNPELFIYVALSRTHANLGLARHRLASLEKDLVV